MSQRMKLLFKVEGGPSFGMGRVTRSLELAREICRTLPVQISFLVNHEPVSVTRIQAAGFRADITPQDPEVFANIVAQQAINIVIFDQESESEPFTRILRTRSSAWLIALDYFNMENDRLHLIVNLLNHSTRSRPVAEAVRYLEGLDYAIVRAEFDNFIVWKKKIAESGRRVLVSFGGSDPRGNTLRVLQAMKCCSRSNLLLDFTVGCNFAHADMLERAASELAVQVTFHRDTPEPEELMYACDVAIIGAGTTLLEAAALGTPALVIAQHAAEARFSRIFEEAGAAVSLGVGGEQDAETICKSLRSLLEDSPKRRIMSQAGKKLVDGRGRQRLATIILEHCVREQCPALTTVL
jgi:spore coat polysaccharide biosynthesis predicted glycosyltransferase SpsG